ncbi:tudor domain-containing protein 5-like [Centruroides sculpturatus]|uniref:tudor domain-containing protein 5-like n=1 Tax=Centruroides sculpturatus TaxID=218467 RepID=UPI000C6E880B|nr:tudor domain-containing protein 5-like [Centruroides sculpturatus]
MEENRSLTEIKQIIRSLIISNSLKITLRQLKKDYRNLNGKNIPFEDFGYKNLVDFLQAMSDVIVMDWSPSLDDFQLTAVSVESTKHIENMIKKQKRKRSAIPPSRYEFTDNRLIRPKVTRCWRSQRSIRNILRKEISCFIPLEIKDKIKNLLSSFENGLRLTNFLEVYETYFQQEFPLNRLGFYTVKDCLMSIPHIVKLEGEGVNEIVRINSNSCFTNRKCNKYTNVKENLYDIPKDKDDRNNKNMEVDDGKRISTKGFCADDEGKFIYNSTFLRENRFSSAFPSRPIEKNSNLKDDKTVSKVLNQNKDKRNSKVLQNNLENNNCEASNEFNSNNSSGSHLKSLLQNQVLQLLTFLKKVSVKNFEEMFKIKYKMELPWDALGYDNIESCLFDLTDVEFSFEDCTLFISLYLEECNLYSKVNLLYIRNLKMAMINTIPSDSVMPGEMYTMQKLPQVLTHYIQVYVSGIEDPDKFWIQLIGKETTDALDTLTKNLQMVYESEESEKYQIPDHFLEVNNVCAALWPYNNRWHRGIIMKILSKNYIEIFYADYGTKHTVPIQFLRILKKEFFTLPSQAIETRLSNVQPINKIEWCERSKLRFMQLCLDKLSQALVTNTSFKNRISVYLRVVSDDDDIHINEVMVNENFAAQVCDPMDVNFTSGLCKRQLCTILDNENKKHSEDIFQEEEGFYRHLCEAAGNDNFRIMKILLIENYKIHLIEVHNELYVTGGDIASLFHESEDLEKMLSKKQTFIPHIVLEKYGYERLFIELNKHKVKGIQETSTRLVLYSFENVSMILICLEHPIEQLKYNVRMEIKLYYENINSRFDFELLIVFYSIKRQELIQKFLEGKIIADDVDEMERVRSILESLIFKKYVKHWIK